MDMFDLENDLPDELMSSSGSWGLGSDHMGNTKPPAQGPGPGPMQNGVESGDPPNALRQQIQINHHLMQQVRNFIQFMMRNTGLCNNNHFSE